MPAFDNLPDVQPCPNPKAPTPQFPEQYKGLTVDTQVVPRDTLLTHLEGQAWQVDYYRQVVTRDSGTKGFQADLNAVYQEYELIRGLELKVTSPLDSARDSPEAEWTVTGSANFYGITGCVPNVGDMFRADVGDGTEGLFQVTRAVPKTMFKKSPYEISYVMVDEMDAVRAEQLAEKTVLTKYFRLDYLRDGYNPLITDTQSTSILALEDTYQRLIAFYFADFYSREHRTLVVPNQAVPTYDPFLVKFVMSVLDIDIHPVMAEMTQYNVFQDQAMYEMTLWNALERLDVKMLQIVAQEMGIVPKANFRTRPMYNSIYYSKMGAVVYPTQFPTNVDEGYKHYRPRPPISDYLPGSVRFRELKRMIPITTLITDTAAGPYYTETHTDQPDIKAVTCDSYYVFSEEFYNHARTKEQLSALEHLTLTVLKGQKVDLDKLAALCEDAMDWDNVERFYYFPVLFLIMSVYPRAV